VPAIIYGVGTAMSIAAGKYIGPVMFGSVIGSFYATCVCRRMTHEYHPRFDWRSYLATFSNLVFIGCFYAMCYSYINWGLSELFKNLSDAAVSTAR